MLRALKIALVAGSLFLGGTALADHGKAGKRADVGERRAKRMARFDLDKDGKLDPRERAAMTKRKTKTRFDRLDKNRDGVLSFDEAQRLLQRGHEPRGHGRQRGGAGHRSDRDE